jgi:hypothetical protein
MTAEEQEKLQADNLRMRDALGRIARWHGEFPTVFDHDGNPSTYVAQYGLNGCRDYMRDVAWKALHPERK